MQNEALARRYATAIYGLAKERNAVEQVGHDLASIAGAIATDAGTREFFVSPTVQRAVKEQALLGAFTGRVNEIALHTVLLLVRKRREAILDALVAEYRKLELAGRGAEPLTVTTARELSSGELRAMVDRLERVYGKKFEPVVKHDPALIGGVRIAMGDRVIDGSVAGRLEELTRTLFGATH